MIVCFYLLASTAKVFFLCVCVCACVLSLIMIALPASAPNDLPCAAVLKDQVCSPGGLTIAGIEALEKNGFRAAAMSAVITVASKSLEMRAAEGP